jgi:DNA repair protein SbcC/Rad50
MRPQRLRIKGFTSFRDEQAVDFTDLDLFALCGPTGSGKSSVLDAMTYALFGKVERVEHASALVSQGQPRMTVSFDFLADGRAYRVTRSTVAGGNSKALLEKHGEDGAWASFGPGADKVRDVNRLIVELIGLDYQAFTRSVLLPQGKFAEFLVGDAAERRKILTELLGLELFEKMAKRANEIKKEESSHAEIKHNLVERSFAGVDADSLDEIREGLEATKEQAERTAEVLEKVQALGERLNERRATAENVVASRKEIGTFTAAFEDHARRLESLARAEGAFKGDLNTAKEVANAAVAGLESAREERTAQEQRWGSSDELAVLTERAKQLTEVTELAARSEESVGEARAREKQSALQIEACTEAVTKAKDAEAGAEAEMSQRTAAHDDAHRHDRVGSLVHGMSKGEPCPVCERPLEKIPSFDPSELDATAAALETARKNLRTTQEQLNEAKTALAVARKEHASALEQASTCEEALAEARARRVALTGELASVFDGVLPADPVTELRNRAGALRGLIDAEQKAHEANEIAREQLATLDQRRHELEAKTAEIRTRMDGAGLTAGLDRMSAAAPEVERPDLFGLETLPTEAEALAGEAEQTTKLLQSLEADLDDALRQRGAEIEELTAAMVAAVPLDLGVRGEDPGALLGELRELEKTLAARAAVGTKEVAELEAKLEQRRALEDEVAHHREQQAAYSDLQKELRSDRIVQHLQAEALVVLADAATHHLRDLSDARYRLVYDEDRFFVVDAWNGDEKRNVKTLSGGETFLTSLALALALSEQIQLLSVTEKSRLESLFLDEGFGQLDTELLEVVVNAIEQMRDADRLVGVVTHVADLADRMPVRLEVAKSPRGSTIGRSTTPAP